MRFGRSFVVAVHSHSELSRRSFVRVGWVYWSSKLFPYYPVNWTNAGYRCPGYKGLTRGPAFEEPGNAAWELRLQLIGVMCSVPVFCFQSGSRQPHVQRQSAADLRCEFLRAGAEGWDFAESLPRPGPGDQPALIGAWFGRSANSSGSPERAC